MIPMFCGYLSNQELSYDSYEEESYPNLKNLPANWCFYSPPPQMEVIKKMSQTYRISLKSWL